MRSVVLMILISLLTLELFAISGGENSEKALKENKKVTARPDIPGTLLIDFGFSTPKDLPTDMELGVFGSKLLNFYYYYDIDLGASRFSINPAIGISFEKFGFENNITIINNGTDIVIQQLADTLPPGAEIKKTKFIANYLDIPLEIRWHSKKNDHRRGFKIAVGVKGGLLVTSHTKIKYRLNGENIKLKDKQDFNLSRLRYGAHARVGYGGFNFFFYYGLSELFRNNKGPEMTSATTINFGISLAGF